MELYNCSFCAIDYKGEKVHTAEKFFRKTPLFLGELHYKFEKDAPGITNWCNPRGRWIGLWLRTAP